MTRHTSTQKSLAAGVTWPHPTTWGWGSTILSCAQKGRNESQLNISIWTVVLEKTLESPLDCKEIQSVHSEGDQPWDFFGRNDAKAETPVLWPPHAKSRLIGKDSDAGRDWGQEKKGTTDDEMAGWHYWLDGRESEWTPGVGDGQGGLACCDSWGRKESDMTEWLNWTELSKSDTGITSVPLVTWKITAYNLLGRDDDLSFELKTNLKMKVLSLSLQENNL